jgi:hypothetical protein
MPLGSSEKTRWDWNLMGHVWSVPMMLMSLRNLNAVIKCTEVLLGRNEKTVLEDTPKIRLNVSTPKSKKNDVVRRVYKSLEILANFV